MITRATRRVCPAVFRSIASRQLSLNHTLTPLLHPSPSSFLDFFVRTPAVGVQEPSVCQRFLFISQCSAVNRREARTFLHAAMPFALRAWKHKLQTNSWRRKIATDSESAARSARLLCFSHHLINNTKDMWVITAFQQQVFNKLIREQKHADSLFTAWFSGIRDGERGPGLSPGTCRELTLDVDRLPHDRQPVRSSCLTLDYKSYCQLWSFSRCSRSIRPFPL